MEFALVTPLLLLFLAGVLNYSRLLRTASSVANAARTGAQYGARSPSSAVDTAGIQAAAVTSAPDVTGMTVTSARTCRCSNGGSVSCTGSCGSGTVLTYVEVTATSTASAIFTYSRLPYSGTTTSKAIMRVK